MKRRGTSRCSDIVSPAFVKGEFARTAGGLALLLGLGACYTTHVVPPGAPGPEPGSRVEAVLTTAGSIRFAERTDQRVERLTGEFVALRGDSLSVAVPVRRETGGSEEAGRRIREIITIPEEDVRTLGVREISTGRSGLFAIGAVGGGYLLIRLVLALADRVAAGSDKTHPTPALLLHFRPR